MIPKVFLEKPEPFSPKMRVALGFCEWGEKILLLKRNLNKPYGGTWCAPGGKLEKEEEELEALQRELKEEIGIFLEKTAFEKIGSLYMRIPEMDYICYLFFTVFNSEPTLKISKEESEEGMWMTLKEALQVPLILGGIEALHLFQTFKRRRVLPS